jgi:hypothetical protein
MDVDHSDRSQFFYWARQSNPINQLPINWTVGLLNILNILLNPLEIFSIGLLSGCCPVEKKWTIPNLCFCMLLLPYLGWFGVFFPARLPSPVFPKVGQRTQFSLWPCHLDFSLINGLCIYFFGRKYWRFWHLNPPIIQCLRRNFKSNSGSWGTLWWSTDGIWHPRIGQLVSLRWMICLICSGKKNMFWIFLNYEKHLLPTDQDGKAMPQVYAVSQVSKTAIAFQLGQGDTVAEDGKQQNVI